MNKSKKVICVVTGKSATFAGSYLEKLLKEYGDESNLQKMYVSKEVKAFLKRGYKINDIRKLLNVPEDDDLPPKDVIQKLEEEYQKTPVKVNDTSSAVNVLTSFTFNKSDEDVENFINNHIIKSK
jgi:DNA-binding transcriptional MerR regulator